MKKTLVLGASEKPERYSNKAIKMLRSHQHPVLAIGNKEGQVLDVHFNKDLIQDSEIDTVTLYLSPKNQKNYYDYILDLNPKRVIFNPGTENDELENLLEKKGIDTIEACTLVMLSTGQY